MQLDNLGSNPASAAYWSGDLEAVTLVSLCLYVDLNGTRAMKVKGLNHRVLRAAQLSPLRVCVAPDGEALCEEVLFSQCTHGERRPRLQVK